MVDVATAMQDPFESAFRAAHNHLLHLHERRAAGADIGKAAIFAAYDHRMHAGHAWHPFRQRARDMTRWLGAIQKEIKALNAEMEGITT